MGLESIFTTSRHTVLSWRASRVTCWRVHHVLCPCLEVHACVMGSRPVAARAMQAAPGKRMARHELSRAYASTSSKQARWMWLELTRVRGDEGKGEYDAQPSSRQSATARRRTEEHVPNRSFKSRPLFQFARQSNAQLVHEVKQPSHHRSATAGGATPCASHSTLNAEARSTKCVGCARSAWPARRAGSKARQRKQPA